MYKNFKEKLLFMCSYKITALKVSLILTNVKVDKVNNTESVHGIGKRVKTVETLPLSQRQ